MEIGISTASFFNKVLTEDSYKVIEELGFGLCETFLTTFSEYENDFARLLEARKGDLNLYSIHTLNQQFEPELYNSAPRTRADGERIFKLAGSSGGIMGAKYYVFHGPARLRGRQYNFDYERLGTRTEELCAILREAGNGMQLCYENVSWAYFYNPQFFEGIKKYSPSIRACLDIKQAMQSGLTAFDFIDCMQDRLSNVHLCDYDADGKLYVPGKGIFDFTEFFVRLLDIGYDGALMMELYPGNYKTFDEIKAGYEYLKNCLERAKNITK